MKAALRYLMVGVLAFIAGVIAFLPASVAAGWVESMAPVELGGVTGTLFAGHAAYVSAPGGGVDDVDWRLHPLSLLFGRVSADIDCASDLDGFSATVSRSLFGTNRVDSASGRASIGWLARLAGQAIVPMRGDAGVTIDTAVFDDQLHFSALAGRVRVANASLPFFDPVIDLGRFTARLTHADDGIRATVVDATGPLALQGDATLDAKHRYALDVRLRARTDADARLGELLDNYLGAADGEGWHRVRERGRLF